ncbi:hypothetical protein Y032_0209g2110 [Ancylostoma ceylanicum]|uniref:G-protein coupled receptors family 1 profile domain-containing protein n=1 Tax=Ancylostoma ceylanicum TaxID=53326 RepID=A0A016SKH8_9BILA|nr:hypothetical protein Y032_0209g2110 [Ancylostoma ceylanicum]
MQRLFADSHFVRVSRYHHFLRLYKRIAGLSCRLTTDGRRHMTEVPIRAPIEAVEIAYLSVIVTAAVILNSIVLTQLITTSKAPTVRTSFSIGPYHLSAFTQFKLNLCITDFAILLIYALGKIVWLLTFQWELGNIGCKTYQFLSAFSFYANSNIIVAIGLDRLKVVYTRHIQGATSVRRVRCMLVVCWILAAVCSLPQAFVWRTHEVTEGWYQCTTIFAIHEHQNTTTVATRRLALWYELSHQATVFWIPFSIIFVSYLLIVIRLLHYTFRPKEVNRSSRSSVSDGQASTQHDKLITSSPTLCRKETAGYAFQKQSIRKQAPPPHGLNRTRSIPAWRRQLRSRVFRSALAVVLAHVAMWLPYNTISTLRFIDFNVYRAALTHGGNFLEDLIVVNSLVNPLLYAHRLKK